MKLQSVLACALLIGCRYGGSDEDPLMGFEPADGDQGLIDAAMSVGDSPTTPATTPPKTPATTGSDGGKPHTTSGGVDSGRPPANAGTNACEPAKPVASCDPIRNTGCPPLTQCDIETSASTPTGRCVFFMDPLGGPCSASFVSVGCDPQNTCVAGACRKLCYCDADCPQGQSCTDASGPGPAGAFKLCR